MTDTTKLLKYAEGLNLRNGETSATICFHSDHLTRAVAYDGQAGEVIKVLLEHIAEAIEDLENDGGADAKQILEHSYTRATAILGGDDAGK